MIVFVYSYILHNKKDQKGIIKLLYIYNAILIDKLMVLVEQSYCTTSEISRLRFASLEMTVFCHSERSRGISYVKQR